jgi:hypothetical protein
VDEVSHRSVLRSEQITDPGTEALNPRELFAVPWEGEGSVWLPLWLRWVPVRRSFHFRTEITKASENSLVVIDTLTFPNGKTEQRQMRADQASPTEFVLAAPDMPRGGRQHWHARGFDFEPYLLRVRILGPVRVTVRVHDQVRLADDGKTLVDSIEARLLGILVGRVTIRLRRNDKASGGNDQHAPN